ncbi:GNAT family N-acetyltransferase [Dendrosporobacter sp. 1207_IL3150]|uniref:GNAT family N-acetyltransferase n=1 Tax=Dendrosporobacter sp. 1207_IL3150 TaxID=3084054 RepID=UPI002FD8C687
MRLEIKNSDILFQISELLVNSRLVPEGLEKENLTFFYHVDDLNQLIGVIGVETYGNVCLLRSLAVKEDKRNLGIARNLLKEAFDYAYNEKVYDIYLLTETISDIMTRYGFSIITRNEVPPAILKSPFLNGLCPCSCLLMHKNIKQYKDS